MAENNKSKERTGKNGYGGREPMFTNAKELEEKINSYYDWCKENDKPICITGLAWYLKTNRMTLLNYKNDDLVVTFKENNPEEYKNIVRVINEAYARVEYEYESFLFDRGKTIGGIFTLKNNFQWRDQSHVITTNQEQDLSLEEIETQLKQLESNSK